MCHRNTSAPLVGPSDPSSSTSLLLACSTTQPIAPWCESASSLGQDNGWMLLAPDWHSALPGFGEGAQWRALEQTTRVTYLHRGVQPLRRCHGRQHVRFDTQVPITLPCTDTWGSCPFPGPDILDKARIMTLARLMLFASNNSEMVEKSFQTTWLCCSIRHRSVCCTETASFCLVRSKGRRTKQLRG
jgi:hypothetical protein